MDAPLIRRAAYTYRPIDIYHKIIWFINYLLYVASNLWNVFSSKEVALFVSIVISMGILFGLGRVLLQINVERKKGLNLLLNESCKYLLFIPFVILMSSMPNLVVMYPGLQEFPPQRYIFGPEIALALLIYWGSVNIIEFFKSILNFSVELQKKIITIILIILTIIASYLANHNVSKYIVKLQEDELRYVKGNIQEYGVSKLLKTPGIYILSPNKVDECGCVNEFDCIGSRAAFSATSMVKLVLYELRINSDIPIIHSVLNNAA